MKKLLKIEWLKNAGNVVFWIVVGLYALSIITEMFGAEAFINKVTSDVSRKSPIPIPNLSIYTFPLVWHNITYLAGFLKPLLAFIVILLITNEYSFRTIRQHLINGLSRTEWFLSKVLFIGALSLFSVILVLLSGLILGLLHSKEAVISDVFGNLEFFGAYFIELLGISSFALVLSVLLKRSGLTIVGFSVYYIIIEPLIRFNIDDNIAQRLPMKSFGNLIDVPNTSLMKLFGVNFREFIRITDVLFALGYIAIFLIVSYLVIKKRDV